MRPLIPAFLVLLCSSSLFALEIIPPAVDSHTFVRARFASPYCAPEGQAIVSGSTIRLGSTLRPGISCVDPLPPTMVTVNVGLLKPGVYEVIAGSEHATLIVRDADTDILVSPVGLATDRRRTVEIFGGPFFAPVTVLFDGQPAEVEMVPYPDRLVVTPPAHAAGTVDAVVSDALGTRTAVAAFTYFDPAAPPDLQIMEPVLLPIGYEGAGIFGSQWTTTNIIGTGDTLVRFRRTIPVRTCEGTCATQYNWSAALAVESDSGVLLWVVRRRLPAGVEDEFRVSSRIAETSRPRAGTSLPVAREDDFRGKFQVDDVPVGGNTRTTLRLYSWVEAKQDVQVVVRFANGVTQGRLVTLTPVNGVAYAAIDLTPPGANPRGETADVSVRGEKLFGMATVTDNETQEVTAFWPQ